MKSMTKVVLSGLLGVALCGLERWPQPAQALSFSPREIPIRHDNHFLTQTGQMRSDRVVGFWRSSSGAELTLAYTGRPETLMLQIDVSAKSAQPNPVYIATWISNSQFVYVNAEGSEITAQVHASGRRITVRGASGWSAEWMRKH